MHLQLKLEKETRTVLKSVEFEKHFLQIKFYLTNLNVYF
jgi:hypothetical protein